MGRRTKRKHREDTPTSPSSSDDDGDEDTDSSIERRRSRHRNRGRSDGSSRRDKDRKREKEEKRRRKDRDRERKRRKSKKRRDYESESSASGSGSEDRESDRVRVNPGDVVKEMLSEFPNVGGDLKQFMTRSTWPMGSAGGQVGLLNSWDQRTNYCPCTDNAETGDTDASPIQDRCTAISLTLSILPCSPANWEPHSSYYALVKVS